MKLSFRSQALDNVSPDQVELDGEPVPPADVTRRAQIAARVSGVTASTTAFVGDRARLWVRGREFVAEVLTTSRDRSNRPAPVICHGELGPESVFAVQVADALDAFARRIGRTVPPEALASVRALLAEAQKKSSRMSPGRVAILAGLLLALALVAAFWAASGGS